MVRQDVVCVTLKLLFVFSFLISAEGTCSIASSSPESSAAVREGSAGITRSVILSQAGALPHH